MTLPSIEQIANEIAATKYGIAGRTPYDVQVKTIAQMIVYWRFYNLNDMGTGKTFCTLAAFDYLRKYGLAHRMIVFAPLSVLASVWQREVLEVFPYLTSEILHGTQRERIEALQKPADVYLINHDGHATIADELDERGDIDVMAIDELAKYRNGDTKRNKAMRKYASRRQIVWGLTGSPMPRAVTDPWGQCVIVTPQTVPKHFTHMKRLLMVPDGPFDWKPKPGAVERAVAMMQPSVRYSLDDVLELPQQVMTYQPVEMGKKQAEVYKVIAKQAVAMIDGHKIDALNAGAVLSKLLQIALGWVYTRDGATVPLDNQARIETIVELADAAAHKVLVFVPFKSALKGVSNALTAAGISNVMVSGDTPPGERALIFARFQSDPNPRVIVAHPACLSHGLTLTAADTIIWGAPITSLETFQQACARIRRIGQKNKQYIILLGGTAVEQKLYKLLAANDNTQERFLELLRSA